MDDDNDLMSKGRVAKRYGRTITTLNRWTANPEIKFPKPDLWISGRAFWKLATLKAFDERMARQGRRTAA